MPGDGGGVGHGGRGGGGGGGRGAIGTSIVECGRAEDDDVRRPGEKCLEVPELQEFFRVRRFCGRGLGPFILKLHSSPIS